MHSIEKFKNENNHVLMFGQLLCEIYEPNVLVFIGELRALIETDCNIKILNLMDRGGLEASRIPYSKIRSIVDKVVVRNSIENSVEIFMEKLREKYPTVAYILRSCTQSSASDILNS